MQPIVGPSSIRRSSDFAPVNLLTAESTGDNRSLHSIAAVATKALPCSTLTNLSESRVDNDTAMSEEGHEDLMAIVDEILRIPNTSPNCSPPRVEADPDMNKEAAVSPEDTGLRQEAIPAAANAAPQPEGAIPTDRFPGVTLELVLEEVVTQSGKFMIEKARDGLKRFIKAKDEEMRQMQEALQKSNKARDERVRQVESLEQLRADIGLAVEKMSSTIGAELAQFLTLRDPDTWKQLPLVELMDQISEEGQLRKKAIRAHMNLEADFQKLKEILNS